MNLRVTATAAFVAFLGVAFAHSVQAQRQYEYQTANPFRTQNPFRNARQYEYQTAGQHRTTIQHQSARQNLPVEQYLEEDEYLSVPMEDESLISYSSFDADGFDNSELDGYLVDETYDSSCDSFSEGGAGLSLGGRLGSRPGQFFFVGEYIYARASLSQALAYIVSDPNDPQGGQEFVEYDFDYQSSYRFSGGYRLCDCGGEIVFNFARFRSEAGFNVQDTSGSPNSVLFAPYEVAAPGDNGILTGNSSIDLKSYDLGFSKTIPSGSPLGDCYDSCCDSGWCPAWDFTWSAGLRFAQVNWARNNASFESQANGGDAAQAARTQLDFEGAGARVGMLGRRYIGHKGFMSVYAKGDLSLLVGNMNIRTDSSDDAGQDPPPFERVHSNSGRRMIPVTEIEAGATAHLGPNLQLSAGYFLSAWHDLGFRDEYNYPGPAGGGGGGFQLAGYDDANILGFDGFFARAEISY